MFGVSMSDRWTYGMEFLASGNFIAVNRSLVKAFGLDAAVMVGELASEAMYWYEKGKLEGGWFYSTIENVEEATGLSGYQQRKAISRLVAEGVIQTALKGLPKKRYIRIDFEKLIQVVNDKRLKKCTSDGEETLPLEIEEFNGNNHKEQPLRTTTSKRVFTPPKPEEVNEYMTERGTPIDAERFCDYYESVGWMRGKTKLKDWRAAARQWARNDERWGKKNGVTWDADLEELAAALDF